MERVNQKAYRVVVQLGIQVAHHIVISHDLGETRNFAGLDFFTIVSSIDNSGIPAPSGRQFTFQEELRLLWRAFITCKIDRKNETLLIEEKMKEAYGNSIRVSIENIIAGVSE